MKRKRLTGAVAHRQREIEELRANPILAAAYLKEALAALADPKDQAAGLVALRAVAEAHPGGIAAIARASGLNRESLYRALSPKGNPTLRTMRAVLSSVGMRLSVEPLAPARRASAKRAA
jgi:probable addiction module antidote protein